MKLSMKELVDVKEGALERTEVADILVVENTKDVRFKASTKAYKDAEALCREAADILLDTHNRLRETSNKTVEVSKKSCASVKSMVNELKDQMLKVDNILGDNVEHKIAQLERIAKALKTINEISKDSNTMMIVKAMVNR